MKVESIHFTEKLRYFDVRSYETPIPSERPTCCKDWLALPLPGEAVQCADRKRSIEFTQVHPPKLHMSLNLPATF